MTFNSLESLNIAVLQAGRSPDSLMAEHGDYDEMCKALLGRKPHEATTFAVLDHEFPPSIEAYDLLIVTGSPHGVYENHDWIAPLEALIREAYDKNIKMLGLCFGHQIMAQALGGTVLKSDKGFGIGAMDYALTDTDGKSTAISLCAWHQDQVIASPKDAITIARSDFCPHAGLRYGNTALSFQPHPEFSKDFVQGLIDLRRDGQISKEMADEAEDSLRKETHPHIIQTMIADFLIQP